MDNKTAQLLAEKYFGKKGSVSKLPGETDLNFKLKQKDGEAYVLKISQPGSAVERIELELAVGHHLQQQGFPLEIPVAVVSKEQNRYEILEDGSILRLQKWVPGRTLSNANPRSSALLYQWGKTGGLLSRYLQGFDHPFAHRFYIWNPGESLHSRQLTEFIIDNRKKEIALDCWQLFEELAVPKLSSLRHSVNYNDAHELNLLLSEDKRSPDIAGLIDFGDVLYTQTVNELAIACAYAGMGMPDPVEAMKQVVRGYHDYYPLEEAELEVLFPLIVGRLLITVTQAAKNRESSPENKYLFVSEAPAWSLLERLHHTPPSFVHYTFRDACGLEPCPKSLAFREWSAANRQHFAPVMKLDDKRVAEMDLSVDSLELGNNSHFESNDDFEQTIYRILSEKKANVGVGGYQEVRPFYVSEAYRVEGNNGSQWRTVHLGVDIWEEAGTPVYSPLDGIVHSAQDNASENDYGPTIILEHKMSGDEVFYTLYGHLSRSSLEGVKSGDKVKKGQQIASLGPAPENGNWPPHLHFQVIMDMLGKSGDYPGVGFPHELSVWQSICPDPVVFVPQSRLSAQPKPEEEIIQFRQHQLGKSLSVSYHNPLHIVRGYKQFLYDTTARRYLDTVNNVAHVGHEHPRVVKAGQQQMGLLNTNTRYLNERLITFAESLLATLPSALSVVHFVNSGSEANELALRMAEAFTASKNIIALEEGYHGNTGACVEVSSYKFDGKGGKGAPDRTYVAPMPDVYRGKHRDPDSAGLQYAEEVNGLIKQIQQSGKKLSGFIAESIMSCGGQIVLPKGYLKNVYRMVREVGGLCIADEVQTGLGRVGEHFWAFELQGVVPDIVTIGKPIGNGHPLGAVVCTREVADVFANGMEYFNTFGGNPVSCAIGEEVLKVIKEEGLQANAHHTGTYLLEKLKVLQQDFPLIGEVRGHGLFLGVELVQDQDSKAPAGAQAAFLINRLRERGLLMSTDGPDANVIKIKPPLCFRRKDADFLLDNLRVVFKEEFLQSV